MNTVSPDILIIGNSDEYITEVKRLLDKSDLTVQGVMGFKKGIEKALKHQPAGIILDVKLNGTDGIEACGQLRSNKSLNSTFIIFYTDEEEEYVHIAALNAGADDYITRPVKAKIMLHRIKALMKRRTAGNKEHGGVVISNGNITIDREQYTVNLGDQSIMLPRKEFELLYLLAAKPGKVFSRVELSNKIWGEEQEVKGRTIDVHIRKIREKIGDQLIRTIKGIGYKWND